MAEPVKVTVYCDRCAREVEAMLVPDETNTKKDFLKGGFPRCGAPVYALKEAAESKGK